MLRALPGASGLWRRHVALRFALGMPRSPFPRCGRVLSGAPALPLLAYSRWLPLPRFLGGAAMVIGSRGWSSVTNAAALAACWLVLTLVLPTLAHVVIWHRAVPVAQGVELTLAQREAVNRAWDIPPR